MLDQIKKTHTFVEWVVIKIDILCTPHTPRYYYLIFIILFFSGKVLIFSDESYKNLPGYRKIKINDYILITGLIPELSYDIFENSFSLQVSLNKIVSNSLALYENQIEKEIFKNNYFEEKAKKNELEKKIIIAEKKLLEKEKEILTKEIESISKEILSLDSLISHQKELLSIALEIYEYQQKEFRNGVINTITFLRHKKDYLSIVYNYHELIYKKGVLENEARSKRNQISNS